MTRTARTGAASLALAVALAHPFLPATGAALDPALLAMGVVLVGAGVLIVARRRPGVRRERGVRGEPGGDVRRFR